MSEDTGERPTTDEQSDKQFAFDRKYSPEGIFEDDTEIGATSVDGNIYAGDWARKQLENTEAYHFGYKVPDAITGVTDVPIDNEVIFRHTAITGATGYGKSTVMQNFMYQFANRGNGFLYIDPKGDDSLELLSKLPEGRLDDVTLLDTHDESSSINLLEPKYTDGTERQEREEDSIVQFVVEVVKDDSFWGPQMDAVLREFTRAIVRLNANGHNLTLRDLYENLTHMEEREEFASTATKELDEDFLQESLVVFADISDEDLGAVRRRIKNLVSDSTVEGLLSDPNGKPASEVFGSDRIIIVRDQLDEPKLATLVTRRVWADQRTKAVLSAEDRPPFGMFIDELDYIAGSANLGNMVSRGRSYKTAFFMSVQQPSYLSDEFRRSVLLNCGNILMLNPGDMDEANHFSRIIDGLGSKELVNQGLFEATLSTPVNGEPELIRDISLYPSYPPVRTPEHALESLRNK